MFPRTLYYYSRHRYEICGFNYQRMGPPDCTHKFCTDVASSSQTICLWSSQILDTMKLYACSFINHPYDRDGRTISQVSTCFSGMYIALCCLWKIHIQSGLSTYRPHGSFCNVHVSTAQTILSNALMLESKPMSETRDLPCQCQRWPPQ